MLPAFFPALSFAAGVPILCYHNIYTDSASAEKDPMGVTAEKFEAQINEIERKGYRIVPLRSVVNAFINKTPLPARSIVITVDDGYRTAYTEILPVARRHNFPVTLFVYPSPIGKDLINLTWEQLKELEKTGLFDIQSHSYSHPKLAQEKERLPVNEYRRFANMQLTKSRQALEEELNKKIDILAWPYGIYDGELLEMARNAGYVSTLTVNRKSVDKGDDLMQLPRYVITHVMSDGEFTAVLKDSN